MSTGKWLGRLEAAEMATPPTVDLRRRADARVALGRQA